MGAPSGMPSTSKKSSLSIDCARCAMPAAPSSAGLKMGMREASERDEDGGALGVAAGIGDEGTRKECDTRTSPDAGCAICEARIRYESGGPEGVRVVRGIAGID